MKETKINKRGISDEVLNNLIKKGRAVFGDEVKVDDHNVQVFFRSESRDHHGRGLILKLAARGPLRILVTTTAPGDRQFIRTKYARTAEDISRQYGNNCQLERPRDIGKKDAGIAFGFSLGGIGCRDFHANIDIVIKRLKDVHEKFHAAGLY